MGVDFFREELDWDQHGRAIECMDAQQRQIAEDDADTQLAEDGGLIQAHGNLAAELRGEDHSREDQPDVVAEPMPIAACQCGGRNRREQSQQQGKASRSAAHRAGP